MASRWTLHPIAAIVQFFRRRVVPEEVTGVSISWTVNDRPALALVVVADGGIHRMGSGSMDNEDTQLFIGVTDPKLFEQVRAHITTDLLKWIGYRWDSEPKGKTCILKIGFQLPKGKGRMIGLKYGSDSLSLPSEVARFIQAARDITNPWYEEFKGNVGKGTQQTNSPSVPHEKPV